MIKLIIFDWGKVLGSGADPNNEEFVLIRKITGLTNTQLDIIFETHWHKIKIGKRPLLEFWKSVSQKSNKAVSPQKLMTNYLKSVTINKEMLALAKGLKKRGYKLAILSNESREKMNAQIGRFDLYDLFDKIYCSADLGLQKPDKRIFRYVINDQNINPQETLFIDNMAYNTEAATSLGINSLLFENPRQLKKDLVRLLSNHTHTVTHIKNSSN